MHTSSQENALYPRHASDRVDELLDALDESQQQQLSQALKAITYVAWLDWQTAKREQIIQFDALTAKERLRQMKKMPATDGLLFVYACLQLELSRVRLNSTLLQLPPHGAPITTHRDQRELMLCVREVFDLVDERDLWPFEFQRNECWPFADES